MKKFFAFVISLLIGIWALPGLTATATSFAKTLRWVTAPVETGLPPGCWFCPIYKRIFILMNSMAESTSTGAWLSYMFQLLAIGIFGFVVFTVGKAFISLKETSMSDLIKSLAIPLGKAIIAFSLLFNIAAIYYFIINPSLQLATGLGTRLLQGRDAYSFAMIQASAHVGATRNQADQQAFLEIERTISQATSCEQSVQPLTELDNGYYDNETYKAIQCFMATAGISLANGLAVGLTIMDWAFDSWLNRFKEIWIGLLVAAGYFMVMLMIGMKLIDPLIYLTVISALMPLWIVLWVFPVTVGYTKKVWESLINVMGTIILLSIVVNIVGAIMSSSLGGNSFDAVLSRLIVGTIGTSTFESFGWKQALWCLGYAMICFKLLGSVDGLVKTLAAGGADMGVAKALENLGIQVTKLGSTLTSNVSGLAVSGATGIVKAGAHGIGSVGRGISNRFRYGRGAAGAAGADGGDRGTVRDPRASAPSAGSHHFGEPSDSASQETDRRPSSMQSVPDTRTPEQRAAQEARLQDVIDSNRWRDRQARERREREAAAERQARAQERSGANNDSSTADRVQSTEANSTSGGTNSQTSNGGQNS